MSFVSTDFTFNGVSSTPYGLKLITMDGNTNIILAGSKSIQEVYKPGSLYPYFFKSSLQPITLNLQFTITTSDAWDATKKNDVLSWLYSPTTYADFISDDNTSVVYKLIFTSPAEFLTFDNVNGYLNLTAHAMPCAYTPLETYSFSVVGSTPLTIDNQQNIQNWDGTYYYYPKLWIDAGATSIQITNANDSGRVFELDPIQIGEELYVDNALRIIRTSLASTNRLTSLTSYNWLRLVSGDNVLTFAGNCDIYMECQYPILT
jgi:phage-related protein